MTTRRAGHVTLQRYTCWDEIKSGREGAGPMAVTDTRNDIELEVALMRRFEAQDQRIGDLERQLTQRRETMGAVAAAFEALSMAVARLTIDS